MLEEAFVGKPMASLSVYVKAVGAGGADQKSRRLTLNLLRYLYDRRDAIAGQGYRLRAYPLYATDLEDAAVLNVLRDLRVSRLPALVSREGPVVGFDAIRAFLESLLSRQAGPRSRRPAGTRAAPRSASAEDDLDDYLRREAAASDSEDGPDEGDSGLAGGPDLMSQYNAMLKRRRGEDTGPGPSSRAPPRREAAATALPAGADRRPARRADNVQPVPRDSPSETPAQSALPPSDPDEESPDPRDEQMVQAWMDRELGSDP